jgi:WD40 repeat protein
VEWLDSDQFITAIGCNLAIGSVSAPDQFVFLEGHSQQITTFALDPSKKVCVSGQCGKENHMEPGVPAIAWDLQTRKQKIVLRGHKSVIKHIAISEDARIVAIGDDLTRKLWLWDLQEQDLACFVDIAAPVSSLVFGGSSKDCWYLHATINTKTVFYTIRFDPRTFEFRSEEKLYADPTKYKRTYSASAYVFPYLFIGTNAGELAVYNSASATLRAQVQIDKFSISAITRTEDPGSVLVGGRSLSLVSGSDTDWSVSKSIDLESPVASICVFGSQALVRTVDTALHLVEIPYLSRRRLVKGTVFEPLRLATTCDTIAVALGDHGLMLASVESGHLEFQSYDASIKASSVAATPIGTFVAGCVDGSLVAVDANGLKLWKTERVHRGPVTACCVTKEFIATGGQDGLIRILSHQSRSLVNEINVHTGTVEQIIPSVEHPERIHSVSADRTMKTTDVSNGKRICQQITSGRIAFTSIQQFTDGETEILVSMGDGTIRGYDWPRPGIIFETQIPQKLQINSIALRPNSRIVACGGESEYLSISDFNTGEWKIGGVGHSTPVRCVTWTADGRYLISAADDGICLWNA